MIHTYRFYKEENRWYIDFPEFIASGGTYGELLMVAGADSMLDFLSGKGDSVVLDFSEAELPNYKIKLRKIISDPFGASYISNISDVRFVWLCNVTKVIMNGIHPKRIYVRVHQEDIGSD